MAERGPEAVPGASLACCEGSHTVDDGPAGLAEVSACWKTIPILSSGPQEIGGIETHVEDTSMAGTPYRSHLGNIAVRLTLVLEGRVTDIAETLGVLHSH